MQKDFDRWNKVKKEVNALELRTDVFYHQREVWWCSIGLNVDVETDGKQTNFERPVLVLRKFNKEMFWGIPLTSKPRKGKYYEKVIHDKGVAWVMLTQMRVFSSKRLLRKIGMISTEDFRNIQKRIYELLIIKIEPLQKEGLSEAEATNKASIYGHD